MFIDTHCHINDQKLAQTDVVANCVRNNVQTIINMGCDAKSSLSGKELSENNQIVYFASGIHPSEIEKVGEEDYRLVEELAKHSKCLAIGEIGLDYHWLPFDKEKQQYGFIRQLDIAKRLNLPVSIHSRDATADMTEILLANKEKLEYGGVLHCYSGSKETAKIYLDNGLYISFGGTLTFKNASNLREVASFVPLDRILSETDSPYLSPEPYRGKTNEPSNVNLVVAKLAEIKGLTVEQMASQIEQNAKRLFYKLK